MLSSLSFRPALLLLTGVLTFLTGHLSAAAAGDPATGARLLRAQLPANVSAAVADCEGLSRAVVRAIYADRVHAPDILAAALGDGLDRKQPLRRSCKCVVHIFRNAVIVAPRQASGLLETASALYPECADALTEALDAAGDKNPVADGKDRGSAGRAHGNDGSNTAPGTTGDPGNLGGNPNDLGGRDLDGLGFGPDLGSGFAGSPGFPGSPGFVGSSPGGSIALPPPVGAPVTSVVNQ